LKAHDVDARVSALSYNFFEAAQGSGDLENATSYGRHAEGPACRQSALEEAALNYDRPLHVLDPQHAPERARRCQLLPPLGEACWQVGQYDRSKEVFTRAAELARELDAPELLAKSALGFGGRYVVFEGTVIHHDQIAALRRALELLPPGDSGLRARVMTRLSIEARYVLPPREEHLAPH